MSKPVESKHRMKQNNTILASVRHECGALATGEKRKLTVDFSLHLSCKAFSFNISSSKNTVSTFWIQLVDVSKKAWSSYRLDVRTIPIRSACLMPVSDSPRRSQAPKEHLWKEPRVNSQRLDKCTLSAPQSFATQGHKCRIQLLWHMMPGSHRILEYLYLFYNLIVYL